MRNKPIQVAIKIRPSQQITSLIKIHSQIDPPQLHIMNENNNSITTKIQINAMHDTNSTTCKTVYEDCKVSEIIHQFLQGYNVAIMVYGHTGAGKTFTFEGDHLHEGIIPKTIKQLYQHKATYKCSMVQLYNEKIFDMLSQDISKLQNNLKLKWQPEKQFIIDGMIEKICQSEQNMLEIWKKGIQNRFISNNKIHHSSSRSHSIFIINMEDNDEDGNFRNRQALFVDLAGSERIVNVEHRLSKQSIEINKELFFLRKVIKILQQNIQFNKQCYVPYRDSKLTTILKKALGGNCITLMIACINLHPKNLEQSLLTISYASITGKIINHATMNIDPKVRQLWNLKMENKKIKAELDTVTKQLETFQQIEIAQFNHQEQSRQFARHIIQCISTIRDLLRSNKQLRDQLYHEQILRNKAQTQIDELYSENKKYKRNLSLKTITEEKNKNIQPFPSKNKINKEQKVQIYNKQLYKSLQPIKHMKTNKSAFRRKKFKLQTQFTQVKDLK